MTDATDATDATLAKTREEIDAIDGVLLTAVNRRIELVRGLHEHKARSGLPLRDAGREQAMVESLRAANSGPLSSEGVADLVHYVLDLTRREIHGE